MPHSGCSALHGVNPSKKKINSGNAQTSKAVQTKGTDGPQGTHPLLIPQLKQSHVH